MTTGGLVDERREERDEGERRKGTLGSVEVEVEVDNALETRRGRREGRRGNILVAALLGVSTEEKKRRMPCPNLCFEAADR